MALTNLTLSDWGVVSSMIIAVAALCIVIYQEFLRGAKLHFVANQIGTLRMPANNRTQLLIQMLARDILSPQASSASQQLLALAPAVSSAAEAGDSDALHAAIAEFSQTQKMHYNPPQSILTDAMADLDFAVNLYVPISVHNSGRKTAHVRSLVLVLAELETKIRWAFTAFVEINANALLDRSSELKDGDRISGMFSGFSVSAGAGRQLTPWFIPISTLGGEPVSPGPISRGGFRATLFAYDSRGKRIGETEIGEFSLTEKSLVDSLHGTDSVIWLHVEEDIGDAVRS